MNIKKSERTTYLHAVPDYIPITHQQHMLILII